MRPYLALAIGMLAVSSAAILISFARAEGMPAVVIAAWRLTLASLVLAPFALARARNEWRALEPREFALAVVSGISLALHFAFWISSLDYTSVMSSVVFVSTNPLFVALASVFVLRESLQRRTILGIIIAMIGSVLIGASDLGSVGAESLQGDVLALLGAMTVSGYLLIGRHLRKKLSLVGYISIVYSTAAVLLLALALAMRAPVFGYPWQTYALVALLAAGPQLVGHTSYNYALKYLSATFITITILAEPIGATLLAIPLLGQNPDPVKLIGGILILAGIYFAARETSSSGS